jgi:CRISPR-associated protein Csb1
MNELTKFDTYLNDDGPAALVIREWLTPVEGADGVLFPATFAAGDNFPGGYNIDVHPSDTDVGPSIAAMIKNGKVKPNIDLFPGSKNVCLVDSVGSQANRIEPIFASEKYRHLVPQIAVKAGDKVVSIFEAGHRAGDALVRCSSLQQTVEEAFRASVNGDAELLAKFAPTSLVFGVWNSRGMSGTQDKRPRIVASSIRAFDVRKLTRGAVYTAPTDYTALDVFSEEEKAKAEGDNKNPLAKRGFVNALASATHGGVIADGGIRRDATLGLAALRLLYAGKDMEKTLKLRRYILGLALVAFMHKPVGYLRQGCLLVRDPEPKIPHEFVEVLATGERKPVKITQEDSLHYATAVATAFGIGESKTVDFEKDRAKRDVTGEAAAEGPVTGIISEIARNKKSFKMKTADKTVNVKVNATTQYLKADAPSTFDAVVVKEAAVVVESVDGVAVKVTAQ